VSHLLQQTAANVWASAATRKLLARTERTYAERRAALVAALAARGIAAQGDSGLGVWVPVREEVPVVQLLLDRGWAVSPGERFRFAAPPALRITTTELRPTEANQLAALIAEIARGGGDTYAG
jgi:DNA-binding transcriptional MocR family regulator